MSARQPWDRDAPAGPAFLRNLVRRPYLVATEDEREEQGEERVFETSHPCTVGDIVSIPTSILPSAGDGEWEIVAREAAAAPMAARLIVRPARL